MENNTADRQVQYERRLVAFEERNIVKKTKKPREILAEGIRNSTQITDEKTVNMLTDKAMHAESVGKNKAYDEFLFNIAESLEGVRCETTSQNEYFNWIDESEQIMKHMTDGKISDYDLHERNAFISMSWQRESELLTCLALYEQSDNPMAKKRHAELMLKLVRLRQLRSAVLVGTQNVSDEHHLTPEQKARLRAMVKALQEMREYDQLKDYHNQILLNHLRQLQISHEMDVEFYKVYSFYTKMLEDERRAEEAEKRKEKDYALWLAEIRHENDTKEDVRNRIFRLTGRKINDTPSEMSMRRHERAFDANSYMRLKKLRDLQQTQTE